MVNKTGILLNHAYSLLDVFELTDPQTDKIYKLVRIRNPWGQTEWNGRWSDTSNEVNMYRNLLQEYVNNLEPDERFNIGDDDGTFFMLYEDWSKIFNKLYVALDFPDNWSGLRFSDEWDKDCAGGFPVNRTENEYKLWTTNPQYLIQINKHEELEFFVSLNQQDWRIIRGLSILWLSNPQYLIHSP